MSRPVCEIAEVFRSYGAAFEAQYARLLGPLQLLVLKALAVFHHQAREQDSPLHLGAAGVVCHLRAGRTNVAGQGRRSGYREESRSHRGHCGRDRAGDRPLDAPRKS